jgi:amphi-Trp domain-containing protein
VGRGDSGGEDRAGSNISGPGGSIEFGEARVDMYDRPRAWTSGPRERTDVTRHLFDIKERATHSLVADQLRSLADQIAAGSLDMAYDEWHAPTVVVDPIDVVVDLVQKKHEVELTIQMRWPVEVAA